MLTKILIGIIIISIGGIVFIIYKKLSHLAVIDVSTIPSEKAKELEEKIITKRMKGKMSGLLNKMHKIFRPVTVLFKKYFSISLNKLKELENQYRTKRQPATREEKIDATQKIKKLLEEADELMIKEEYAEAEKKCIEAVSLDDKNIEAFRKLGNLYFLQKNFEQAEQTFQYVLKINKSDDVAYDQLGVIKMKEGKIADAEKDLEFAIKLNKGSAIHFYDLSLVRYEMGKMQEAADDMKHALELEPNNPKYIDFLIELCIILKDKVEAQRYIEKLKEANPDNKKIEEYEARAAEL